MDLKVYVALFLIHCNYQVESTLDDPKDCETAKGCMSCCLQVDVVVDNVNEMNRKFGFRTGRYEEYIKLSSTKKDGLTADCTFKSDTHIFRKGPACNKGTDSVHYTNGTFVLYKFTFNCTYTKPHQKPPFDGYFILKILADPMVKRTLYYTKGTFLPVKTLATKVYYREKKKDEIYSYTCYGSKQFKKICEEKRKGGQAFELFSFINHYNYKLWENDLNSGEDGFFCCEDDDGLKDWCE